MNRSLENNFSVFFKSFGMIFYKIEIDIAIFDQAPSYGMMQCDIGSGIYLQMKIGNRTGICFAWICYNDFYMRICGFMCFYSSP